MEFMVANIDLGELYLSGDFNTRTGSEHHEPVDTDYDESFHLHQNNYDSSHIITSSRTSKDVVFNKRGNDFLDFLTCTKA